MTPEDLALVDVARMNLLFAKNLSGSEGLDMEASLRTIDELAAYVQKRTKELRPKFEANPQSFRNSEAFFKMTVLVTVLQLEKGLVYDPKFAIRPGEGYDKAVMAEMVKSSKNIFINGLLGEDRLGTCSSIPVLWAAIGRRLGYPLKMAHAKNHLFVRWDDGKERFNVEASQGRMASPPDEEYKTWPFPLTDEQIAKGPYLKNLTPTEEMADAMAARFWQLLHFRRENEALGLAIKLRQLLPNSDKYLGLAEAAAPLLSPSPFAGLPPEPSVPNPTDYISSSGQTSVTANIPDMPKIPDPLASLPAEVRAVMKRSGINPNISEYSTQVIPDPYADLPPVVRAIINRNNR